jgi:hypothetical protein
MRTPCSTAALALAALMFSQWPAGAAAQLPGCHIHNTGADATGPSVNVNVAVPPGHQPQIGVSITMSW